MIKKWPEVTKTLVMFSFVGAIFGLTKVGVDAIGFTGTMITGCVIILLVAAVLDVASRKEKP